MGLYSGSVSLGCDPELFLARGGQVIGAETVIDKSLSLRYAGAKKDFHEKGVVLDGVQVELNPPATTCREGLASSIGAGFRSIRQKIQDANAAGVSISLEGVVRVDQAEMDKLSDRAKTLGCQPSLNMYNEAKLTVPKDLELMRSAGGHIHLGLSWPIFGSGQVPISDRWGRTERYDPTPLVDHRKRLVPIEDVVLGNTSVLMDRNPLAAERRKVYGKAGEYRLPEYGLEYRVLSNFWLRNYSLFSTVFGLARLGAQILYTTRYWEEKVGGEDLESKLLSKVDLELVQRAINMNDINLAKVTYKIFRQFTLENLQGIYGGGICAETVDAFDYFLEMIEKRGLEFWFPEDPVTHWADEMFWREDGSGSLVKSGSESFFSRIVPGRIAQYEEYGDLKPWEVF